MLGGRRISELLQEAGIETPAYLYDLDGALAGAQQLQAALAGTPHLVAYAVKANSAGSILRTFARAGLGADVVSGGELTLALAAGVTPDRVVMSGVAKTDAEIQLGVRAGIRALQVESVEELRRVTEIARAMGVRAPISVRLNPNVRIDSHAHISTGHDAAKFGVAQADLSAAFSIAEGARESLKIVGFSSHVGSMLSDCEPYLAAAEVVCDVAARYAEQPGAELEFLDFGGGFGVDYGDQAVPAPARFAERALALLRRKNLAQLRLVLEPGRSLIAPFGVLVAKVIQPKQGSGRRFLMLDAGMNDLLRPALYGAKHRVEALNEPPGDVGWRVVGPVCESSDDFGVHWLSASAPEAVVIRDAGAYGFSMASEYNGRALPAEVFIAAGKVRHVSPSSGVESWVRRRLSA